MVIHQNLAHQRILYEGNIKKHYRKRGNQSTTIDFHCN